jgi:hypothetical protein
MDQERFRTELEAKTAAHDGDVLAAISEMLGEVIEDLESLPSEWREIVEAGEILGTRPKENRGALPRDSHPDEKGTSAGSDSE